ncbi:hypothetical protein [Streptomyces sp. SID3343]|uniref:hypothetical protein n=1 Tax=Streptomyces sp. SID3343 TaxID=2690260 RepID=UPI00136A2F1E|nr:hypothetical protein [Streptomyces sp. SID3343]MYW06037.1 hypothetical protein [Streptomyces sp. SID3343]
MPPTDPTTATTTAVVTITTADGVVTPAWLTVPATTTGTVPAHPAGAPYEITTTHPAAPAQRTAAPQWAIELAVAGAGIGAAAAGIGYGIGAAAPGIAAGADLLWALAAVLAGIAVLTLLLVTRRPPSGDA